MRTRNYALVTIFVASLLGLRPATALADNKPTGNPIVDAPKLQADIVAYTSAITPAAQQAARDTILNFFTAYFPAGAAPKTIGDLLDSLTGNAFLTQELRPLSSRNLTGTSDTVSAAYSPASVLKPQAGNLLSGTNLEDVLATFIANRFKQELEMAFLDKMKTWLENHAEYKPLLPNTWLVLDQNDPFNYSTFFEALKEALEKDIRSLPGDVGTFLGGNPFNTASATSEYNNIVLLYQSILQIVQGQNGFAVLAAINKNPLADAAAEPIGNGSLRLVGILTRTLINPTITATTALLAPETITGDLNNADKQQCFIGLLLLSEKAEFRKIRFSAHDLYTIINLANNTANTTAFITWLNGAVSTYTAAAKAVDQVTQQAAGFKKVPSQLISSLLNSVESIVATIQTFPYMQAGFFTSATYQAIDGQLKIGVKIVSDMADSNYGLAFTDLMSFIKTGVLPLLPAAAQNDLNKLLPSLQLYGGFAVSVAKAKNNADLESALESAALPVGSYRIKRTTYKNISLNAWAGVFGGWQTYPGSVPTSVNTNNLAYGFTVPIGVAYSWGEIATEDDVARKIKKDDLNGNSNTLFLSIVDLGAITAFRAFHDSTATLPDFKWQNTLAPGLFFVHGFRKSPLSLGGGIQYGPQLRSISNNTAVTLPSAITFRILFAVDIPLFNFYTRTTKG